MSNTSETTRQYDLVESSPSDGMLQYTVNRQKSDIETYFPGIQLDFSNANSAYLVCYKGSPAGIFVGCRKEDSSMEILLDYSLPEFRDFSIGKFLFSKLSECGITSLSYNGPVEKHQDYLDKNGFVKTGDTYIKVL